MFIRSSEFSGKFLLNNLIIIAVINMNADVCSALDPSGKERKRLCFSFNYFHVTCLLVIPKYSSTSPPHLNRMIVVS